MGSQAHFDGKNFAPGHGSVTDGAKPIIEVLVRCCREIRIRTGIIQRNVGARCFTVKLVSDTGALRMTVVTNGGKQEFYLYNAPSLADTGEVLRNHKKLHNFIIHVG